MSNTRTTQRSDSDEAVGGDSSGESIRLEAVRKRFGDLVAVDGVDLDVAPGELVVLLGPSGCGKTTTLRMIAGLETVTEGTVRIGETDVTEVLPQKRDASMVFQNYALYPHKTVRENLAFPLGKTDLDDDEKRTRIRQVAERLEITDLLDKDPDQLSGGQRQRVAVGRTIIREPSVFLMDEPLSNLDAKLRVQTRAELRALQQQLETTMVYVTHDQEEALSIADRIVIMRDGTIEQIGDPEELYAAPATEFVAGFLGDPAMNFLDVAEGTVFDGRVTVADLGLSLPDGAARIGVRPEDVVLAAEPERPDAVAAEVDVVEPLGHAYEVTLRRNGTRLVVKTQQFDGRPDETWYLSFPEEHVFAFDASGVRL
jgi:multiple sugar transport system ATP-binding protein